MNNTLITQITGKQHVTEDDVLPVPAGGLSRSVHRDRLSRMRRRRGEDDDGNALHDGNVLPKVSTVLGEGKGDVIPDDAEELDTTEIRGNVTSRMHTIKDVVEEPGRPRDPDEIFISPKTALTAPDATPESMTQSDPSSLPGADKTSFTVPQLDVASAEEAVPEVDVPQTNDSSDTATRTMDVLLGRKRSGSAAKKPEEFAAAGAVATTEAQAQAMLGIGATGDSLLGQNVPMPPPAATDNKAVYESFRRWA